MHIIYIFSNICTVIRVYYACLDLSSVLLTYARLDLLDYVFFSILLPYNAFKGEVNLQFFKM